MVRPMLHRHLHRGMGFFFRRMRGLVVQPVFIALTLLGNACIALGAAVVFMIEASHKPQFGSYLDALWWAVATATSVGYGDIVPITVPGRLIGIAMMLLGTALFAAFTALFASALLVDELQEPRTR